MVGLSNMEDEEVIRQKNLEKNEKLKLKRSEEMEALRSHIEFQKRKKFEEEELKLLMDGTNNVAPRSK